MTLELYNLDRDLSNRVKADARQKLADEAATLQRYRTAELEKLGRQTPQTNWDLPDGYQFGTQNAAPPAGAVGRQTGGGAGYVGRPQGAVTDNAIEVSEASNRLQAMKRAQGVTATPGLSAMDQLLARSGRLSPSDATAIQRMDARSAPVPSAAVDAMQSRLKDLQSVEGARQRGQQPQLYGKESDLRGAATQDIGAAPGAIDREIAALRNMLPASSPQDRPLIEEEMNRLIAQKAKYSGSTYVQGSRQPAAPSVAPAVSAAPQAAPAPAPAATFSGMGPGGAPQMMQEQINLAKFQYQQLQQMLPYLNPEQQSKAQAQMMTLYHGARAQQAYMLAAQSDTNPQALGQLVALAGAQAARTADGAFVLVDPTGRAVSQPMSGGQLGAYLFRAMDEKSRAAQADMQGKIALEQAKALAQAQGKLLEQGGTTAELEHLKALMEMLRDQNKPASYGASVNPNDPSGRPTIYNQRTGEIMPPPVQVNSAPLSLR